MKVLFSQLSCQSPDILLQTHKGKVAVCVDSFSVYFTLRVGLKCPVCGYSYQVAASSQAISFEHNQYTGSLYRPVYEPKTKLHPVICKLVSTCVNAKPSYLVYESRSLTCRNEECGTLSFVTPGAKRKLIDELTLGISPTLVAKLAEEVNSHLSMPS